MSDHIQLAGGDDVPAYLVEALEEFDKYWPGATLRQARPGIINAILKAQRNKSRQKKFEARLIFQDDAGNRHTIGNALFDKTSHEALMKVDSPRFFVLIAENTSFNANEITPE